MTGRKTRGNALTPNRIFHIVSTPHHPIAMVVPAQTILEDGRSPIARPRGRGVQMPPFCRRSDRRPAPRQHWDDNSR
eukprot:2315690-Pyramimonas_sp.AAC.1